MFTQPLPKTWTIDDLSPRRLLYLYFNWRVAGSVNDPGFIAVARFFFQVDPLSINMAHIIRYLETNCPEEFGIVNETMANYEALMKSELSHA